MQTTVPARGWNAQTMAAARVGETLDDGAGAGVNRLPGNLTARGKAEKEDRGRYIFGLGDAMEQVLQRAAGRGAQEGVGVPEHPGHSGGRDSRRDRIDVDVMRSQLRRGAAGQLHD